MWWSCGTCHQICPSLVRISVLCRFHNGDLLAGASDLTLSVEAARDSAGEYACQLANAVGDGASPPIHIDVLCKSPV